ncbi:MAG: 4Fe-4S dicluster domain-containing protein [Magnetococcales bacterium]|nr:4Fe-4S dicluster domain-containing protein [Magnetococcales bacterium]
METLSCDCLVVGAGPAGLAAALGIRLLAPELSVWVLEKGSRVGAHILAGAMVDPSLLDTALPDWRNRPSCPVGPAVIGETLHHLTPNHAFPLPIPRIWSPSGHLLLPNPGAFCRWLAAWVEEAGGVILPKTTAMALQYQGERVVGVRTGDFGRDRHGQPGPRFQPGFDIQARITLLAEGCRGFLTTRHLQRFPHLNGRGEPTHSLGFREVWQLPEAGQPGRIRHTVGWPLTGLAHGGGFLYQLDTHRVALGLVVALDYRSANLFPFGLFEAWKHHPLLRQRLQGGRRLSYGARTIQAGGFSSLPRCVSDGVLLLGDAAGLLDTARLQGIAPALSSGTLAAPLVVAACRNDDTSASGPLGQFADSLANSETGQRLRAVRNVRPGFRAGLLPGLLNAALEAVSGGAVPWTLRLRQNDAARLHPLSEPAFTPVADQRTDSLVFSGLRYREEQPSPVSYVGGGATERTGQRYGFPERLYCPAAVFRSEEPGTEPRIQPRQCLHCRSCAIKDPLGHLLWQPPEGGDGPDYAL